MAYGSTHIKINMLLLLLLPMLFSTAQGFEKAMKIEVLHEENCERKSKSGDVISMHYRGTLETTGKEFDSSYSRKQPFEFKLGSGMVIPGWEQGVQRMCVGEKRRLTIPPSLAYGDTGFGDIIPAKSTLVFEIELMAIKGHISKRDADEDIEDREEDGEEEEGHDHEHEHEHPDSFEALDLDGNKEISMEEMTKYIKAYQEGEEIPDGEDSVETIVSEIFQEDDKNKDGVISYEEYQHSAGMYEEDLEEGDMEGLKEEL